MNCLGRQAHSTQNPLHSYTPGKIIKQSIDTPLPAITRTFVCPYKTNKSMLSEVVQQHEEMVIREDDAATVNFTVTELKPPQQFIMPKEFTVFKTLAKMC